MNVIKPAFLQNNVVITLAANERYVPYVSVVLLSLKRYFSADHNYDILIMHRDMEENTSQKNLKNIFEGVSNVSLRFIDVTCYEEKFEHLFVRGHFALETYFRLLLPDILNNFEKVIYLDSDVVVNVDVAELYHIDIDGYLLAACHDPDTAGLYNGYEPNKKFYMDHILKIKNPYEYFQAGVILFNLSEFRKQYTGKEMLDFAALNEWELLDQDVLNYFAQGKYKSLDMAWNVLVDWRGIRFREIISLGPENLIKEYVEAYKEPKIIHYAGPDKPWAHPESDKADVFWEYAKQSIYYKTLMQRLKYAEFANVYEKFLPVGTLRRTLIQKVRRKIVMHRLKSCQKVH